jgi:Tfp pilus assembly PilM family ATPase
MNQFWDKITKFFSEPPQVSTGFYISPHYFCGVTLSAKEKRIDDYYIQNLPQGVVRPSLNEKNIIESEVLKQKFLKAIKEMKVRDKNVVLIFPEWSQKAFTFSFDSLPHSPREREKIIRFRIRKKMPFLPEDARVSYDLISKNSGIRAVVILTRDYIVKEYQEFLDQFGLKMRIFIPPSVGLINLLKFESDKNYFLLNVEQDGFSLSVHIKSEFILYRQKRFNLEMEDLENTKNKIEDVFHEVENTLNFIEGSQGKKDLYFLIRCGINCSDKLLEETCNQFSFSFDRIGSVLDVDFNLKEAERLSPILGVML